jgi:hypothetical protein
MVYFTFEGKRLKITGEIYEILNCYYIPLSAFINAVDNLSEYGQSMDSEYLKNKGYDGHNLIFIDNKLYSSLFYLTQILNLKTTWDYKENTINLFYNRDEVLYKGEQKGNRPALIRLEDVTAGAVYGSPENLEKLRIIGDMFFSKNICFHIAWIPRYVNPGENIDNDLIQNYSIYNCDFIYTLDYLISKGGIVGLHGYTHQYGNEESAVGSEFTSDRLTTEKEIRERVEKSINTANTLNIPYSFFETPHYAATKFQIGIIEEYFHYIYEGYCYDICHSYKPCVSPINKKTIFVPTPLDYVEGDKKNSDDLMLLKIKLLPRFILASLFYHAFLEFPYINILRKENGYPSYEYKENSLLNNIIKALLNKKCVFTGISEIKP